MTIRYHPGDQSQVDAYMKIITQLWIDYIELWKNCSTEREEAGRPEIEQKHIAGAAGVPTSTLSDWITKKTVVPDWRDFKQLFKGLGVDPEPWLPRWKAARDARTELSNHRRRSRKAMPDLKSPSLSDVDAEHRAVADQPSADAASDTTSHNEIGADQGPSGDVAFHGDAAIQANAEAAPSRQIHSTSAGRVPPMLTATGGQRRKARPFTSTGRRGRIAATLMTIAVLLGVGTVGWQNLHDEQKAVTGIPISDQGATDDLCNVNESTWVRVGAGAEHEPLYTIRAGGGFRVTGPRTGAWVLGHGNDQPDGYVPNDGRLVNC